MPKTILTEEKLKAFNKDLNELCEKHGVVLYVQNQNPILVVSPKPETSLEPKPETTSEPESEPKEVDVEKVEEKSGVDSSNH